MSNRIINKFRGINRVLRYFEHYDISKMSWGNAPSYVVADLQPTLGIVFVFFSWGVAPSYGIADLQSAFGKLLQEKNNDTQNR